MIVKALQTYLEAQSGVTNIVSTRIYPHHLPPNNTTYPVLTHQMISNNHDHNLDGAAGNTVARVQIDCWGLKLSDVETLAEAVRNVLQGYSGAMGTVDVGFVQLLNELDLSESPKDASSVYLYRRMQEYSIKHAETIPSI